MRKVVATFVYLIALFLIAAIPVGDGPRAQLANTIWAACSANPTALTPKKIQSLAAGANPTSGATYAITLNSPVGVGHGGFVDITYDTGSGEAVTSVQDNASPANTYTLVKTVSDATDAQNVGVYANFNIQGQPSKITVTFSVAEPAGSTNIAFTEVQNIASLDVSAGQLQTASTSLTSTSATTTVNGDFIHGVVSPTSGNFGMTMTAGAGFTLDINDLSAATGLATEYEVQSTAGSIAATFTAGTSATYVTIMAAAKASTGSGCSQPSPPVNAFFVCPVANCANASGSNPGTFALPFATLGQCQSAMQSSSIKTCFMRNGTYALTATLLLTTTDNGENWDQYLPDGIGSAMVDAGTTIQTAILCNGCQNVTFNGFQIQNFVSAGIGIHGGPAVCGYASNWTAAGTANNVTAANMIIHNGTSDPANVFFNGALIIQGQVTNSGMQNSVVFNMEDNGMRMGANDDGCTPGDTITGDFYINNVVYNVGGANDETACYYAQDVTAGSSTGMKVQRNFGRDCGTGSADKYRGIYFDLGASNITDSGNVIILKSNPGTANSGTDDVAQFLSGGHNDNISGNLYDLSNTAEVATLAYLQTALAAQNNYPMTGNVFNSNVIVGKWTGSQNTNLFGSAGQSMIEGCTNCGTVPNPTVNGNDWFNYGGGSLPPTGNFFNDANPSTINPGITGRCFSPQFSAAILALGIPQLPTTFGYTGYGGPPAKACSWSTSWDIDLAPAAELAANDNENVEIYDEMAVAA